MHLLIRDGNSFEISPQQSEPSGPVKHPLLAQIQARAAD